MTKNSSIFSFKTLFTLVVLGLVAFILFGKKAEMPKPIDLSKNTPNKKDIEVAILGTSVANHTFHADLVKAYNSSFNQMVGKKDKQQRVYGFAKPGTSISHHYFWFKNKVLPVVPNLKLLVYTFNDTDITAHTDKVEQRNMKDKLLRMVETEDDYNMLYEKSYLSLKQRLNISLSSTFDFFMNSYDRKVAVSTGIKNGLVEGLNANQWTKVKRKSQPWYEGSNLSSDLYVLPNLKQSYLKHLIDLCQSKGIKLVVVENPAGSTRTHPRSTAKGKAYLSELQAFLKANEVPYHDLNAKEYKDALFSDGIHFRKDRDEKYEEHILKIIKKHYTSLSKAVSPEKNKPKKKKGKHEKQQKDNLNKKKSKNKKQQKDNPIKKKGKRNTNQ